MFASQTLGDGRTVANIRNILTFPGLGFAAEQQTGARHEMTRIKIDLPPAHPTPARSAVRLAYAVGASGPATLRIYDVSGRLVRTLFEEYRAAGSHEATWDRLDDAGWEAAPGVYLYRLDSMEGSGTGKVILVAR